MFLHSPSSFLKMLRAQDRLQLLQHLVLLDRDRNLNAVAVARAQDEGRERARRRWWVRPWILRRPERGWFDQLMHELRLEDVASFRNFLRVEPDMFRELSDRLEERLSKKDTSFRYYLLK